MAAGTIDSFGIVFNPKIEGRPDAALVIGTDAQNIKWDTVKMLGIGVLPRLVISSPSPGVDNFMRFDSVALGDSVCQSVSLSNPGSDTLHFLRQIKTSSDYDFTFYPLTGTDTLILPGQSKLVNVCFHPIKNGNRQATIRFYTDVPRTFEQPSRDTSQFVLNISGVGVPFGVLSFSGPTTDTALVGVQQCITDMVKNTGQSDLTIENVSLSGVDASAFTWTPGAPITLQPGQSQTITICFKPTVKGNASATAALTVVSAGRTTTQNIPIAGFGKEVCGSSNPATQVAFSAASGGKTILGSSDSTDVVVTNCGNTTEMFSATAPAPYVVTPATSAPVAPGATTTFHVKFTPTAMAAAPGNLAITGTSGADAVTPMSIALGGIGGNVVLTATNPNPAVDTDDCQNISITVTNNGNMDWSGGTPTITGPNAADFTYVSGPGTVLAGNTGIVIVKFCPKTIGSESATLTFSGATPVPTTGAPTFQIGGTGQAPGSSSVPVTQRDGFVLGQSYPNPTTGSSNVTVTLPKAAPVRIDIVDVHGTVLRTEFTGTLNQGDHTLTIDAKGLANGTYFYVLTSGTIRLAREIAVMH